MEIDGMSSAVTDA